MNNKEKESVPKPGGIISYLRELSIVIIGVLITLTITNWIGTWNRQKEVKGMLGLVTEELKRNLSDLEWTLDRWYREQYAFRVLNSYGQDWEKLPADTLLSYTEWIGSPPGFEVESDFFESLKNSSLAQEIRKKSIVPELSRIYRRMSTVQGQLESYSNQKAAAMINLRENLTPQDADLLLNGSPYDRFRYPMDHKGFRRFMIEGGTIPTPGLFEELQDEIRNFIRRREKQEF